MFNELPASYNCGLFANCLRPLLACLMDDWLVAWLGLAYVAVCLSACVCVLLSLDRLNNHILLAIVCLVRRRFWLLALLGDTMFYANRHVIVIIS